jgi:hypothetical protein
MLSAWHRSSRSQHPKKELGAGYITLLLVKFFGLKRREEHGDNSVNDRSWKKLELRIAERHLIVVAFRHSRLNQVDFGPSGIPYQLHYLCNTVHRMAMCYLDQIEERNIDLQVDLDFTFK